MQATGASRGPVLRRRLVTAVVAIVGSYLGLAAALSLLLPRYAVSVRHIVSESAPTIRLLSQLRSEDAQLAAELATPSLADSHVVTVPVDVLAMRASADLQALRALAAADPGVLDTDTLARLQDAFVHDAEQALREASGKVDAHLAALRRHQEIDRLIASDTAAMLDEAASTDRAVRVNLRLLAKLVLASTVVVAFASLWLLRGALGALRDFELAQAARQREAEDRARELDLFAAAVAHDLRQPLGTLGLVLHGVGHADLPPKLSEAVTVGQRSIRRLDEMIRDLLEYARDGGEPGAQDLTRLEDVVVGLQAEFGLRSSTKAQLLVSLEPELEMAMKPGVVRTILSNLIDNAVNHADADRAVTVRLTATRQSSKVLLEVADDGPGIPPEVLPHIFERFRRGTVRGSGYGLGLATVQRIVTAHHGSIEVDSTIGVGTRFLVTIPARSGDAGPTIGKPPTPAIVSRAPGLPS
jgi:signal transduction histidine kinase